VAAATLARLYLVTPPDAELDGFPDRLGGLLDRFDVACVRMAGGASSEEAVRRAAEALRPVCHARDVPLVLTDHFRLAAALGLDGVHLTDGARQVRAARKALGFDAIVGAHARASRHDGMTAAEIGADYVSFGPLAASGLGDGTVAPVGLIEWWAEMIEVPVVAEGGLTPELAGTLARTADFLALGPELWLAADGPEAALDAIAQRLV
jgi:thiamine-phosphate pyrophosphorylase